MAWEISRLRTSQFNRRFKDFSRTNEQELLNCFDNLVRTQDALNEGASLANIAFLRNEKRGLFACDERGEGKKNRALRLYIYPDLDAEIIYVLQLGDKKTQREDIRTCHELIQSIRAGEDQSDAGEANN